MSLLDRDNLFKPKESSGSFMPRNLRNTMIPDKEEKVSDKLEIKERKVPAYHIDPYFQYNESSLSLSEIRKKHKYPMNLYYYIYGDRYTPEFIKEKIESIPNHEEFLKESISKCFQSTNPDKAYDAILLIFNTNEPLNVIKKEVGISDLHLMLNVVSDYVKFYLYETITGKHYDMMHTGLDKYIIEALRRHNIYSFSDLEKELENLYKIDGLGLKGLNAIRNNEVIIKVIDENKMFLMRKSKTQLLDSNISITEEELNDLRNKTFDSYPII
jgi:hypothetical protein